MVTWESQMTGYILFTSHFRWLKGKIIPKNKIKFPTNRLSNPIKSHYASPSIHGDCLGILLQPLGDQSVVLVVEGRVKTTLRRIEGVGSDVGSLVHLRKNKKNVGMSEHWCISRNDPQWPS